MLRTFGRLLALSFALLLAASCSGSGAGDPECSAGTEDCACRNETCDGDLECRSSLCVKGAAQGGSAGSGSAGSQNGGANNGNAGASTVGGASSGAGTAGATAGTNATGGTSGGVGSAGSAGMTSGGAATCNDTASDPKNCGQCGHACQGDCKNGQCAPYPAGCFDGDDGFATCAAYCSSIGETCVAKGCGSGTTLYAWDSDGRGACEAGTGSAEETHSVACDAPIQFGPGYWILRCCCTDTQ